MWDWNGTLLADIDAVVAAANSQFTAFGARELSLEEYRASFSRPVRAFHERHVGRVLSDPEWATLDADFHRHYWDHVHTAALSERAEDCLGLVRELGWTQSLLSMAPHSHVVEIVAERGLAGFFERIDGNHGEVGAAKEHNLREHLRVLGQDAAETLLIGDAVDDAAAAHAVGARAVLVEESSCHSAAVLRATGAPVARTIVDALELARAGA